MCNWRRFVICSDVPIGRTLLILAVVLLGCFYWYNENFLAIEEVVVSQVIIWSVASWFILHRPIASLIHAIHSRALLYELAWCRGIVFMPSTVRPDRKVPVVVSISLMRTAVLIRSSDMQVQWVIPYVEICCVDAAGGLILRDGSVTLQTYTGRVIEIVVNYPTLLAQEIRELVQRSQVS